MSRLIIELSIAVVWGVLLGAITDDVVVAVVVAAVQFALFRVLANYDSVTDDEGDVTPHPPTLGDGVDIRRVPVYRNGKLDYIMEVVEVR